uniref:HSR domain-containing protein n=1 Tax=Ursus maritimus TaxID=29073 RepID=A0A452UR42_URSMA
CFLQVNELEVELLDHVQNKVEIANTITKPFPFLESLRDCSLIMEEFYNVCEVYYISP